MSADNGWPRIALVTPVFNSGKYIEATIRSVLAQGYPNLEYYIVDGGSTDGTLEVIRKYESQISGWISEPDNGMYDAINKGFARTSGEVMGWISATDMLQVGGLAVAGSVFGELPEVEWITGLRTVFNEEGMTVRVDPLLHWSRYRFLAGASLRHVQQESTFWRRSLWEKAGGYVDASWRYASDFELWVRFFRYAKLYAVNALIGGFREHSDSMSLLDLARYNGRCDAIAEAEMKTLKWGRWPERCKRVDLAVRGVPGVKSAWARVRALALRGLYGIPGPDFPPVIEEQNGVWLMRRASRFSSLQRGRGS